MRGPWHTCSMRGERKEGHERLVARVRVRVAREGTYAYTWSSCNSFFLYILIERTGAEIHKLQHTY